MDPKEESHDQCRKSNRKLKLALICGAIGYCGACLLYISVLRQSPSSTAPIGILFVPLRVAWVLIPFLVFGYCFPDLASMIRQIVKREPVKFTFGALLALVLTAWGLGLFGYGLAMTITTNSVRSMTQEQLSKFLEASAFRNNKFILGAVAENPNTSSEQLDLIAHKTDSELSRPMMSVWPVMGKNTRFLSVMRLIARHKNVSPETLAYLAKNIDELVRSSVAENSKTPAPVLRDLYKNGGFSVQHSLAYNRTTPQDLLEKLSLSTSEYVRLNVARNANATPELLAKLAQDPNSLVRTYVAAHPNTAADVLDRLADDPDKQVQDQVLESRRERTGETR